MRRFEHGRWLLPVVAMSLALAAIRCGGGGGGGGGTPPPSITVTVGCTPSSVALTMTSQCTATVTGTANTAVTWSATAGSIDSSGKFTAPADLPNPAAVTVKAVSQANGTSFGTFTVTITSNVTVNATCLASSLQVNQSTTCSAIVTGTTDTKVTWGATAGTIDQSGNYTAPATVPAGNTATITATSVADTSKSSPFNITITSGSSGITVTVSPNPTQVAVNQQMQFSAAVAGTANTAVTWSVSGGGSINLNSGLYTAPSLPPGSTVTVTALSQADNKTTGAASVTILPAVSVSVGPPTTMVTAGGQQQFTATVTGTSNTGVLWSVNGTLGGNLSTVGSISASGMYAAPSAAPTPDSVTVSAASMVDPSRSGALNFSISGTINVSVVPAATTVAVGEPQQFNAYVTGTANTAVNWSVDGIQGGNQTVGTVVGIITGQAVYTAPASAGTHNVTATSQVNSTQSSPAQVTVVSQSATVAMSDLYPIVAVQNRPAFTLTLDGTGFVCGANGSQVIFNGTTKTPLASTCNSAELQVAVASSDLAQPGVVTVNVVTTGQATAPLSFAIVPPVQPHAQTINAGQANAPIALAVTPLASPTLTLYWLGTCDMSGNCTAYSGVVTLPQGASTSLWVIGPPNSGIIPGTFYVLSGPSDITVTQPLASSYYFFLDNLGDPTAAFDITVSPSAELGLRDLIVVNPAGEIAVYPGALQITGP